jgi:hypothetical protein
MIELVAAAAIGLHVQTSLSPRPALFGDTVTAHVDVFTDPRRVDPRSVGVRASFAQWHVTERTTATGSKRSFRFTLSCLESTCLPHTVRFAPVVVTAHLRDGRTVSVRHAWPAFDVLGRIPPSAEKATRPPFRAQTALPKPSFRVAPTPLALALDILAALLAAGAAALVALEIVRVHRRRRGVADDRPPVVRALELVREAEGRAPADRRKAVGHLARTLDDAGGEQVAERASRVAWSPEQPSPDRLERLADEVEQELER